MHYKELSTPALVVDLDVLERNLQRMAAYCSQHHLHLRPHIKTHKTVEIARMQLELGAFGLTVAKVGEAEVMVQASPKQILVAHPIFGEDKLRRLAHIAREIDVLVAVDDEATAAALSQAAVAHDCKFGLLVEMDTGSHRCGLPSASASVTLGQSIEKMPGVHLRGLATYFGHVWGMADERMHAIQEAAESVQEAVTAFRAAGLPLEIVSGGSTPAAELSHLVRGLTEIRPGTYVFNDLNTYYQGLCKIEDCAARIVTTVVSTAVPGQAIVDAGSKTFSHDALSAGPKTGYGYVVEDPASSLFRLNEEHGYLKPAEATPKVGDVLTIIPNHVCTCINMHDEIYLIRNEVVVGTWQVAARGKIR